jgi:hypothetical protein
LTPLPQKRKGGLKTSGRKESCIGGLEEVEEGGYEEDANGKGWGKRAKSSREAYKTSEKKGKYGREGKKDFNEIYPCKKQISIPSLGKKLGNIR